MTRPTPIALIDLDGVLVDAQGAALERRGVTAYDYAALTWNFHEQFGLTYDQLWGETDRAFWAGLPWTPEGKALVVGVEALAREFHGAADHHVGLLSKPVRADGCRDGKQDWVDRNLPTYSNRLFLGAAKWVLSSPRHVLIDDSDYQVQDYVEAGGRGVVVPRPWNSRRRETDANGRFDVGALLKDVRREYEEVCSGKWPE